MARKKVVRELKLQIPAGKATPAPPVGPALGQAQVNIPQFVQQFNDATRDQMGYIIPVIIYVYDDRTFSFVTKTPPASDLLKKVQSTKGSGEPNKNRLQQLLVQNLKRLQKWRC